MSLFERLKADNLDDWHAYTRHSFVQQLASGELPEPAFRTYLQQDYLFLIHFSRAYALAVYKSPRLADMRNALEGLKAIMDVEMDLHIELCAGWGISRDELETLPEASETMAYTRFVLETGLRGDLLDLQVALAPCILGYGEVARENAHAKPAGPAASAYRRWLDEYGGNDYQSVAQDFSNWTDQTAEIYMTEARFPALSEIFNQASRLEADFWQMGLNA
ncbi:thiaminase II [Roseibium polysiphoniae]|uniref:Aminopyrimidine aminohydrolase n=1 Tax=Roseibium polysiphoniae TaxID=2571221 RepID=A0A944CB30_9HYPH|nr:thiaminase II [Roseibium polysiphoniae]